MADKEFTAETDGVASGCAVLKYPKKRLYIILSFFIPFIIMGTVFALNGVFPFGDRQILLTDFWQQYYPFLSDLWRKLREGVSPMWSWTAGLGGDYLALIAYYMASPLNFLLVLFPFEWLREAITLFFLVKIGLAGLSMCLFLRYSARQSGPALPVFASFYALCAFTTGYFWNIMWFDTFALMPLVMLGLTALIREGKYKLYIISLAIAVAANYYIGFFICVFTAIIFFAMCYINKLEKRVFLRKLALVVFCSVIALGLTAFLTLPAFSALQDSYSASSAFPKTLSFYNDLKDILGNFIAFTPSTSIDGLPNVYCGVISVMLAALFVRSPKVSVREKVIYVCLTAFLILSCNLNALYYIWNAFHFTNQIPFRFSFMISFMVLIMAYRAYWLALEVNWSDILAMGVFGAFFVAMAAIGSQKTVHVIGSAGVCAAYLVIFSLSKLDKPKLKRFLRAGMLAVALAELFVTALISVSEAGTSARDGYPTRYAEVQEILNLRESAEEDFYRTEFARWYSVNDPSMYGYNGVAVFSSTASANTSGFAAGLGLIGGGASNRYYYGETSPLTNAFLNVRYLISRSLDPVDNGVYWENAGEYEQNMLMENKRYLPLGFMVNEETARYEGDTANPFQAQNDLFRRAVGLEGDLFNYIDIIHVGHKDYEVVRNGLGDYSYDMAEGAEKGVFKWNYIAPKDCMVYVFADVDEAVNADILLPDGGKRTYEVKRPHIFAAGEFKEGEQFSVWMESEDKSGNAKVFVCYIDQELFDRGYEILADETLDLTEFSETRITGDVTVSADGLLYTSIPGDSHWKAYVDGESAEITLIDGAMAALSLSEGNHQIEFRYINKTFYLGALVSGLSLAVLIIYSLIQKSHPMQAK